MAVYFKESSTVIFNFCRLAVIFWVMMVPFKTIRFLFQKILDRPNAKNKKNINNRFKKYDAPRIF